MNKKITQLTELNTAVGSDLLAIVDVANNETKKITKANLLGVAVYEETPSGTVDGVNVTFVLTETPTAGTLRLFLNGARQQRGTDYTLLGDTITFTGAGAPPATSIILADYKF